MNAKGARIQPNAIGMHRKRKIEDFVFDGTDQERIKSARGSFLASDVNVHARKASWVAAYGEKRIAKCMLCQFNEVGWENVGFDLAHVVARCCNGNNTALWNRVPVCNTCNQNTTKTTNLLDFAAKKYPERVVPVVQYLFGRFTAQQPHLAAEEFRADQLESFARFMYGKPLVEIQKYLSESSSLQHFRKRSIRHSDDGGIQSDQVYALLRAHDHQMQKLTHFQERIEKLQCNIEALQDILQTLCAELDTAKKNKKNIALALSPKTEIG